MLDIDVNCSGINLDTRTNPAWLWVLDNKVAKCEAYVWVHVIKRTKIVGVLTYVLICYICLNLNIWPLCIWLEIYREIYFVDNACFYSDMILC